MSSPEQSQSTTYSASHAVEDFKSASQNNDPLLYPGERPGSSYVTDGSSVYDIQLTAQDNRLIFELDSTKGCVSMDSFLRENGVPTIEERIPVLAFGANMSPGSLATKFSKIGRDDAKIIPTVYATLPGHDVVWSGGPGVNGNFISIMYQGEETQDTQVEVGVNFLTREQLLVMHATELAYDLNTVEVDIAGVPLEAYFYDGVDSVFLEDGKPVAVASVPATNRAIASASTRKMLDGIVANADIMTSIQEFYPALQNTDANSYVAYTKELAQVVGNKLALKKTMHQRIAELGKSKIVDKSHSRKGAMNWANPSMLPTYGDQLRGIKHQDVYVLPSQEIPEWSDPTARAKVLRALSTHLIRLSDGNLVHKSE